MEHPTPWKCRKPVNVRDGQIIDIEDANGRSFLRLWKPEAERVVAAVNAHDGLVAALKAITASEGHGCPEAWDMCHEALAAAKGKK